MLHAFEIMAELSLGTRDSSDRRKKTPSDRKEGFAHSIRTAGKRRGGFQGFLDRNYRIIRIMKAPNTLAHCENPVNLVNPV